MIHPLPQAQDSPVIAAACDVLAILSSHSMPLDLMRHVLPLLLYSRKAPIVPVAASYDLRVKELRAKQVHSGVYHCGKETNMGSNKAWGTVTLPVPPVVDGTPPEIDDALLEANENGSYKMVRELKPKAQRAKESAGLGAPSAGTKDVMKGKTGRSMEHDQRADGEEDNEEGMKGEVGTFVASAQDPLNAKFELSGPRYLQTLPWL